MPKFVLKAHKEIHDQMPSWIKAMIKTAGNTVFVRTHPVGAEGETPPAREHHCDEDGCLEIVTDDPREVRHLRVDPRFTEVLEEAPEHEHHPAP